MTVIEVTQKIKTIQLLKDIVLHEASTDSQFGVITVLPRHFKDSKKNELKLGNLYSLFVAHMYKDDNTMEEFFYLTFHRKGEKRDFRKHNFYQCEYNKIFASGYSVDEIINDFESKLIGYELK